MLQLIGLFLFVCFVFLVIKTLFYPFLSENSKCIVRDLWKVVLGLFLVFCWVGSALALGALVVIIIGDGFSNPVFIYVALGFIALMIISYKILKSNNL